MSRPLLRIQNPTPYATRTLSLHTHWGDRVTAWLNYLHVACLACVIYQRILGLTYWLSLCLFLSFGFPGMRGIRGKPPFINRESLGQMQASPRWDCICSLNLLHHNSFAHLQCRNWKTFTLPAVCALPSFRHKSILFHPSLQNPALVFARPLETLGLLCPGGHSKAPSRFPLRSWATPTPPNPP